MNNNKKQPVDQVADKAAVMTPMKAHLLMALWALLVGGSYPTAALVNTELSFNWLTCVRFFIACLLMLPFLLRQSYRAPDSICGFLAYLLLGAALAGFFATQFYALRSVSALVVSALFVTVPLIGWLMGRVLSLEKPGIKRVSVLALGAVGALGLVFHGRPLSEFHLGGGEWWFIFGCACSAAYAVFSRWFVKAQWLPAAPLTATFWSLFIGALLMGLISFVSGDPFAQFEQQVAGKDIAVLAVLALFASFLTFWILHRATQVIAPSVVLAYSYLTPLVALGISFINGQTQFDLWLLCSLIAIFSTTALLMRSR